jgi:pyruvate,water dikinase
MSDIAWFNEVRRKDVESAGGKGASLGELTAQQIPVPPGFIISAQAYGRMLQESGSEPRLREILASVEDDLRSAASAASSLILDVTMPSDLATAIRAAYAKLGGGLVAVRSSATAEDLAEASFAGQQSTYLNVNGEDAVIRAVRDCWSSLFEERAVVYRRQVGFDHAAVRIAVVVQSMVQSERSGIMFTVNPVTGDADGMIIEAILGLGEAAVSGMVTPDMYILDKHSLEMQQCEVSHQEQQLVRAAATTTDEEPNAWVPVPPDEGRAQKLSNEQIRELAELGLKIERHYDKPQDIEWAWADGQFFILQARPVTAAGLG